MKSKEKGYKIRMTKFIGSDEYGYTYEIKFNKDDDEHYLKLGIAIGKTKFNLIDFIRGFVLGMAIMALTFLITNP